jgi:acetyl-CoA carboxylase carboxyltransferase component
LIKAREVVPVISAIMGTVSGAAAYSAYMGDTIVMIKGESSLFLWGGRRKGGDPGKHRC